MGERALAEFGRGAIGRSLLMREDGADNDFELKESPRHRCATFSFARKCQILMSDQNRLTVMTVMQEFWTLS